MFRATFRQISGRVRALGVKLRHNCEGIAAVEFGLIAPLLLIMLLGTIELSRAISMDRKFGLVTSTIADLVAREKTLTAADVTAMYGVVQHMMSPWSSSTLKISIIPVRAKVMAKPVNSFCVYTGTTNRPSLNGAAQPARLASYTLPSDFLESGTSVIVVESTYGYQPLFAQSIIGASTWTDKAVLSPRNGNVSFEAGDETTVCP